MIDENKILASVTNTTDKVLTFFVLNPVVNGQPYFPDRLSNSVFVIEGSEDTEFNSHPARNRDRKNPYFTGVYPTGYVSGTENFYPMKLKPGETKNNLVMIKQDLDGMVSRGLVNYTQINILNNTVIKAVNADISVQGINVRKGKTAIVALSDTVEELIAAGEVEAQMTVTSVTPGSGTTEGGETVVINGTNFNSLVSSVKFGTESVAFTVLSSTQIEVETPEWTAGAEIVNVSVTNGVGTVILANGFEFEEPEEPENP